MPVGTFYTSAEYNKCVTMYSPLPYQNIYALSVCQIHGHVSLAIDINLSEKGLTEAPANSL